MEDKEVGKLCWWVLGSPDGQVPVPEVLALIRKLVEERAALYSHPYDSDEREVALALENFGIDPETYDKKISDRRAD